MAFINYKPYDNSKGVFVKFRLVKGVSRKLKDSLLTALENAGHYGNDRYGMVSCECNWPEDMPKLKNDIRKIYGDYIKGDIVEYDPY